MFWNKKKFTAFPELDAEKQKRRLEVTATTKLVCASILLLFPAAWFWSSVVLRLTLGTDYFFDVYFQSLGESFAGNLVVIFTIIFLPGLCVGINGLGYMQRKDKSAILSMIVAGVLLAAGFFAAIKRD